MKYDVTFSCGHTETVALFGKISDRMNKIDYYQRHGLCSCCYQAQQNAKKADGCNEVEMHYGEYKRNYSECSTKSGSYNPKTKTIIVYVPTPAEAAYREVAKAYDVDAAYLKDYYDVVA